MPFLPDLDMEYDPDGNKEQVAVVMKGQTYKDAGLKKSQYPNIEGPLYDKLCQFPRHKVRDDVRKLALNIAIAANEKNFKPTVDWLDNFMRRFCISRKKMGFYSSKMLKVKGMKGKKLEVASTPVATSSEETQKTIVEDSFIHSDIFNALGISKNVSAVNDSAGDVNDMDQVDSPACSSTALDRANNSNKINGNSSSLSSSTSAGNSNGNSSEKTVLFFPNLHHQDPFARDDGIDQGNSDMMENKENGIKMEIDDSSDAESVKELPKEKTPEREVINLDSESEEEILKDIKCKNEIEKNSEGEKEDELKKTESEGNKEEEELKKTESEGNKEEETVKENKNEESKEDGEMKMNESERSQNGIEKNKEMITNENEGNEGEARSETEGNEENLKVTASKGKGNENMDEAKSENEEGDKMQGKSGSNEDDEKQEEEKNQDSKEEESDSNSDSNSDESENESDVIVKSKSWEERNFIKHTKAEDKYYQDNETNLKRKLEEKLTNCTACYEKVNHNLKAEIFTHPLLGVLLCKKCMGFYGKGNFKKDSEGYDEYCRWCANGGDLLICDHCTNGFCKKCVKRNLGRSAETNAMKSKSWNCYVCDLKPLTEVRALHRAILDQIQSLSILKKSFSRRENKDFHIKQRFGALKMRRREQGLDSSTKKGNSEDSISDQFMMDMRDLCIYCVEHVDAIKKRRTKSKEEEAEARARRRICKLADVMEKNFAQVKLELQENLGSSVANISSEKDSNTQCDQNVTEDTVDKDIVNDSEKNSPKRISPLGRSEKRKRKDNDGSDNENEVPAKKIVMETDSEGMEIENGNASVNEESSKETKSNEDSANSSTKKKSSKKSHLNKDNYTSNEDSSGDDNDAFNDAASSKNPDGSEDDEKNEEGNLSGDRETEDNDENNKHKDKETENKDKKIEHMENGNDETDDLDESSDQPQDKNDTVSSLDTEISRSLLKNVDSIEDDDKEETADNEEETADNKEETADNKEETADNKEETADNKEETADNKEEKETPVAMKKGILLSRSKKLKKDKESSDNKEDKLDKEDSDKDKKSVKDKTDVAGMSSLVTSDSDNEDNKKDKKNKNKKKKKKKKKGLIGLSSLLDSDLDNESDDKKEEKKKKKKKEESGISSLIASDSDTGNDSKKKKKNEDSDKEEEADKKSKKMKKVLFEFSSEEERRNEKPKPKCKKMSSKVKNGMKALIDSESDSDMDAKIDDLLADSLPKSKNSKKKSKRENKNYKPKPKSVQNALKEKQLKSGVIKVEKLSAGILNELDKDGYIDIDDYPQFYPDDVDLMLDSESDKELDAILKIKAMKSSGQALDSDNDADSESDSTKEEESETKKEKKKRTPEEMAKRKKKEGLLDINIDKEENEEDGDEAEEEEEEKKKKGFDSKGMKALVVSSEEEQDDDEDDDEEDDDLKDTSLDNGLDKLTEEEVEKKKKELYEKNKKKQKDKKTESESDNEEIKQKVRKKGFLSFKFSSSEEEEEEEDSENESPRKARMFIESDSDFETSKKKKKKKDLFSSSDDDDDDDESSSSDEKNKKDKKSKSRKRIKRPSSSTDEEGGGSGDDADTPKKRRRHIIRDEDLLQSTKDATLEERERRDRVRERQQKYNKMFEIDVETDQKDLKKLVLDFNEETKEELVTVQEKLVSFLKPHQVSGIRFMWDATFENVERLKKGEKGGGCILAHCMGLGKTLQVIAFIHTLITNKKLNQKISRVMVCCPVNTVYNWVAEFKSWLKGKLDVFDVVELISAKDLWARAYRLDDWYKEGGVCIIGYDMFRNLSNANNKRYKGAMKEKFQRSLVEPGPDLMVCDEGHILKNEKTALSIAINKIKTMRRIVLTGTPLQNNLKEYHCMIQFVKPNLLGSKKEFMNRFVHPIEAGQCMDALPRDVRRMKRRAHILHNLLEGCVQRFDYSVLKPFLPPKYEYVISVQMCDVQCKLYDYYLKNLAQGGPKRTGSGLFVDFNNLSRIWSHPVVLYLALRRRELKGEELDDEDEEDLDGFINDSDTSIDSSDEDKPKKKKKKKNEDNVVICEEENKKDIEVKTEEGNMENIPQVTPGLTSEGKVRPDWWRRVLEEMGGDTYDEDDFLNRIEISGKLYLLFEILRESVSIGDKVLLFSQSILGLDMIEEFLRMWDTGEIKFPISEEKDDKSIPQPYTHWKNEKDYYRLDGSTSADIRKDQCKNFNNTSNERCRLFLISTRAGGVGINLVGANRVIIFDSSWNPSHDTQSIFRVYRFGQKKPCYIYRFVAQGTMEEKIYSRQVTKISTSLRVVDEHQIKRYFNMGELAELYQFTPSEIEDRETPAVPEDRLLAELLIRNKNWIVKYHEQESLLENQTGEELTEEERNAAWEDYENEKKGVVPQRHYQNPALSIPSNVAKFDIEQIYHSIVKANPGASSVQIYDSVYLATQQIQKVHLSQYQSIQGLVYNLKNPMIAPEILRNMQIQDPNELLQHLDMQLKNLEENIRSETKIIKQISSVTHSAIPHNSMVSAGLARGNPVPGAVSSTTKYVSRNFPATNLVNTSFKKIIIPPKNMTDASTSSGAAAASDPLMITSDKESTDPAEVVTLE